MIILIASSARAQLPGDFTVEAFGGSYAPWGYNYELIIDPAGTVEFYHGYIDSTGWDSVFVAISMPELEEIYDTVMAAGFYDLDSLYDEGMADGSGISLRITASAQIHEVEAKNYEQSDINNIVCVINAILEPHGIELKYRTLVCPDVGR